MIVVEQNTSLALDVVDDAVLLSPTYVAFEGSVADLSTQQGLIDEHSVYCGFLKNFCWTDGAPCRGNVAKT